MNTAKATLKDGRTVDFLPDMIGEGGMKQVYFTADKSQVVCFFKDQPDANLMQRVDAVLGRFNPTLDPETGDYWKGLFCWPTAIITSPRKGILAPTYPGDFFFASGPWQGKEKEGRWFSSPKLRAMLPDVERGTWINYFKLCIRLSRAVRRLHVAGLAHSDLSCKNVLVDPSKGQAIVIDIDSLVVPGIYAPVVLGTPGYIAPEVIGTQHLPPQDPKRVLPSARTDQHALPVLIYEYLMFRHPLRGPKVHSVQSAEEDERLSMGEKAIYVEHPSDTSNRPKDLRVTSKALGPILGELFERAFVKGLHAPNSRPGAVEWEKGLINTWDMLYPCSNPMCTHKWFVMCDASQTRCAFCGVKPTGVGNTVPVLKFRTERRAGQWMPDGQLTVYNGVPIMKWHVFSGIQPNEYVKPPDRLPLADCAFHQGQWLLINRNLPSMISPGGNRVPPGQAVALKEGAQIRLAQETNGRIAEVKLVHL